MSSFLYQGVAHVLDNLLTVWYTVVEFQMEKFMKEFIVKYKWYVIGVVVAVAILTTMFNGGV